MSLPLATIEQIAVPAVRVAVQRQRQAEAVLTDLARLGNQAHAEERAAKDAEVSSLMATLSSGAKVDVSRIGAQSAAAAEALGRAQRAYAVAMECRLGVEQIAWFAVLEHAVDVLQWVARERAALDAAWRPTVTQRYPWGNRPEGDLPDALQRTYGAIVRDIAPEALPSDHLQADGEHWPSFGSWTAAAHFQPPGPEAMAVWDEQWQAIESGQWAVVGGRWTALQPSRRR